MIEENRAALQSEREEFYAEKLEFQAFEMRRLGEIQDQMTEVTRRETLFQEKINQLSEYEKYKEMNQILTYANLALNNALGQKGKLCSECWEQSI